MIDDPFVRIAVAQNVQNFVDDPYYLWDDPLTSTEIKNLTKYLNEHKINIPNIPSDVRGEDVKKIMYLVWASLECLDCMCGLLGVNDEIQ